MRFLCAAFILVSLLGAPFGRAAAAATVSEYRLPGFQTAALDQDLPAVDAVLAGPTTLWFLGKHNLWTWHLEGGRLARIALPKGEWQKLHFDGQSIYAAGTTGVFQVQIAQKRYFSYDLPVPGTGEALGFGGEGDELWLLHARALMKIDRYGKTLAPKLPAGALQKDDLVALDAATETLWIARGKQLLRQSVRSEPEVVLTAKHPLFGLAFSAGQVILHTEHSVLRLDAATGKTLKSIPVEGGRKLAAMAVTKERHSYAFDDHLLEVFDLKNKAARSYRLPLDTDDRIELVLSAGDTAAVVVNGRPRAYKLGN